MNHALSRPPASVMSGLIRPKRSLVRVMLALALALFTPQVHARDFGRFTYRMVVTEEQDPVDPAISARFTPAFDACQDQAKITSDNAVCFEAEFARQDAVLNRLWKTTFARITGPDHALLLAAQRAWLAARDPFCRSQSDGFAGGTIMPVIYSSCRAELTIRRILWLEHIR